MYIHFHTLQQVSDKLQNQEICDPEIRYFSIILSITIADLHVNMSILHYITAVSAMPNKSNNWTADCVVLQSQVQPHHNNHITFCKNVLEQDTQPPPRSPL